MAGAFLFSNIREIVNHIFGPAHTELLEIDFGGNGVGVPQMNLHGLDVLAVLVEPHCAGVLPRIHTVLLGAEAMRLQHWWKPFGNAISAGRFKRIELFVFR